ncbi:MAG: Flp pilus assembly protein CpaB [Syntrophomonadaceae bacterium]|nr:Flp pilus assembly protein CpaB [Syntrophomonadaceae bacterium]
MKGRKKYWILSLVFALAAAALFYQFIIGVQKRYEPEGMQQVMVATRDIEQNSLIGPGDVETTRIPSQYVHPRAVRDKKDVVGKVAISSIAGGEQILSTRLLGESGNQGRMSYTVPPGKRAISIAVDEVTGVSGFIKPSDRVDVVVTANIPTGPAGQETLKTYTVLALQDLEVLAVGKSLPVSVGNEEKADGNTLTLAVEPQQALILTLAAERGDIRLMLRPPGEQEKPAVPPVDLPRLLVLPQ